MDMKAKMIALYNEVHELRFEKADYAAANIKEAELVEIRYQEKLIICSCCENDIVHLSSGWANECDTCGTEYNGAGQRLAPRSQWGEETGESFI